MRKGRYYYRAQMLFKDLYGRPFSLSDGQQDIFKVIYNPTITRACIKATTQYGKSEVASMALDTIACDRKEKILIIAPSESQSDIIMGKAIDHLFDHPLLTGMIDYNSTMLERLKRERSKKRITFKNGSEIRSLTADAGNLRKESRNLMGFGATIVLVDESCLIPDALYSKIFRMIGGVENGKIIELSNPFEYNHFGRAFDSSRYTKVSIDWRQALAEKRITQEFLDEARETVTELDWKIFYECLFPEGGAEDALIPQAWIDLAVNQKGCLGDFKQSGLDVARFGRDKTVYMLRQGGEVKKIHQTEKMDLMEVTGWTNQLLQEDKPDVHCTDAIGVGSGVHDRLDEIQGDDDSDIEWEDTELVPVGYGESPRSPNDKKMYVNMRAYSFFSLRDWFKPDEKTKRSRISIPNDPELKKQLGELRYKYSSERKKKMESKDEMKKRLGISPDKADALSLAFFPTEDTEPELYVVST